MKEFFELNILVFKKFQEIQFGYIEGIEHLLTKEKDPIKMAWGLMKLRRLKKSYEIQLLNFHKDAEQIKEINVCFKCFDKEKPCTDCD